MDPACIGKYGTIRLLKKHDPNSAVASFPVDAEQVTFGRKPDCSVRLYYPWVSSLHCEIAIVENKAFLRVYGSNGVILDGCELLPSSSPEKPTTSPLLNGSIIEIHKKNFQFCYPPKEIRQTLLDTPVSVRKRSLRLSMIESACVFSPRPSTDRSENLRLLQSPLKPFKTSPTEPETVRLVDGDQPHVVIEEKDLIILEDIVAEQPQARPEQVLSTSTASLAGQLQKPLTPKPVPPPRLIQTSPQAPKTPSSRRRSVPSLHRAVLLRSAHRVLVINEERKSKAQQEPSPALPPPQLEMTKEEAEDDGDEVEEVEDAVSIMEVSSDSEEEDQDEEEKYLRGLIDARSTSKPETIQQERGDEVDITEANVGELGRENDEGSMEDYDDDDPAILEEEINKTKQSTPSRAQRPPVVRNFGQFMTPQVTKVNPSGHPRTGPQRPPPGRFSLGGPLSAMRDAHWKFNDIVLPPPKEEIIEPEPSPSRPTKIQLSEEEKKAIRERRKSAYNGPDSASSYVPGTRRTSVLPSPPRSPTKTSAFLPDTTIKQEDQDDPDDIKTMFERMKDALSDMRRKSLASRQNLGTGLGRGLLSPSPSKGVSFANLSINRTPGRGRGADFSLLASDAIDEVKSEDEVSSSASSPSKVQIAEVEVKDEDVEVLNAQSTPRGPAIEIRHINLLTPLKAKSKAPNSGKPSSNSAVPQTPSYNGLRDMFRPQIEPTAKTPKFTGLREMYAEPKGIPPTPAMSGLKQMFHQPKDMPATPNLEGLNGMFRTATPLASVPAPEEPSSRSDSLNQEPEEVPRTVHRRGPTRVPRTVRTDMSSMADDEMTPSDSAMIPKPTSKTQVAGVPAGAIVRRGRPRKGAHTESTDMDVDVQEVEAINSGIAKMGITKTTAAVRKNAKEERVFSEVDVKSSGADSVSAPKKARKTRAKTEEVEVRTTDAESQASIPRAAPRRGRPKKETSSSASTRATTATRRSARTKSSDIEDHESTDRASSPDVPNALQPRKNIKAINIDSIPEEEEQSQSTASKVKKPTATRKTAATATRATTRITAGSDGHHVSEKENEPGTTTGEDQVVNAKVVKGPGVKSVRGSKAVPAEDLSSGKDDTSVPVRRATRVTRARK